MDRALARRLHVAVAAGVVPAGLLAFNAVAGAEPGFSALTTTPSPETHTVTVVAINVSGTSAPSQPVTVIVHRS